MKWIDSCDRLIQFCRKPAAKDGLISSLPRYLEKLRKKSKLRDRNIHVLFIFPHKLEYHGVFSAHFHLTKCDIPALGNRFNQTYPIATDEIVISPKLWSKQRSQQHQCPSAPLVTAWSRFQRGHEAPGSGQVWRLRGQAALAAAQTFIHWGHQSSSVIISSVRYLCIQYGRSSNLVICFASFSHIYQRIHRTRHDECSRSKKLQR